MRCSLPSLAVPTETDPAVVVHGDCLDVLRRLPDGCGDAVVADPPYGMRNKTDSTRFRDGRDDWPAVRGDDRPFDPAPWLDFPKVILWGSHHYAAALPVGTTLVWIKRADHLFGTFLSDAEVGWMKGGHGVYCHRKQFPPSSRAGEGGGRCAHPNQKPIDLMRWCLRRLKLRPGSLVFDPYAGSGTVGVACLREGLRYLGVEIDPTYCAAARRRLDAEEVAVA